MAHYNADEVKQALSKRHMLIRLHDDSSVSPLYATGFTATLPEFQSVGQRRWQDVYQPLRRDKSWLDSSEQLDSVIKHVTGGWVGYYNSQPSPWISTSADLDWAIWEIARRLVHPSVKAESVSMSLVDKREWYSPRWRGAKAIYVQPTKKLDHHTYNREEKAALDFASASSEVLVYGRIFRKSVLETRKWTLKSTGFAIPPEYSIPRNVRANSPSTTGSWIDRLVWDPRRDGFKEASSKIRERRERIYEY